MEDVAGGLRAAGRPIRPEWTVRCGQSHRRLAFELLTTYANQKIAGCITLVHTGNADVLAFVKDRIAGKPATASC